MDLSEYQQIVSFISTNSYPDNLQDTVSKVGKNKRDNFKAKAKKFFLKGDDLYRYIAGNISGAKVVLQDQVQNILAEFHGSTFGGHSGVNKTREAIKSRYWWLGLTEDVKNYISSCEACQKSDPLKPAKKPELKQIKVSSPFELVGVDLVGPLTETDHGNKYIFTATDYFTKWVEAFPIPSKSASDVAKCFQKLFARHGAVNAILTDQGREFLNHVNEQLCKDWNIQHRVTAAYHPQTNGLDEKTNQTLKTTLRKLVNEHQTDWDQYIDGALFSQRTKPHSSTKFSPFFLLYGREAVYPSQLPKDFCCETAPTQPSDEDVTEYVNLRVTATSTNNADVKSNMDKAHQKQQVDYKKRVQKGRKFTTLDVGQTVLVHNAKKTATKKKGNLEPNYMGPYTIVKVTGKMATLQNSDNHVLKKQFSLDHLKLFNAPPPNTNPPTFIESPSAASIQSSLEPTQEVYNSNPVILAVQQYLKEITSSGQLQDVINFVSSLPLTKPSNLHNLKQILKECPVQSFVAEVSKCNEEEMDVFATHILPRMRQLPMNLQDKTTVTMIVSGLCVRASRQFQPIMVIAETLKNVPSHLQKIDAVGPLNPGERLSVGGETLEEEDLATLRGNEWLNDKIINSYLGVMKIELNTTDLHIFVFPSYTAVLWESGQLDHWLFQKVQFSLYKHLMMPINDNGNHWMLMSIDIKEKTVTLLDSMNGQKGLKWFNLWRNFMDIRNNATGMMETLGPWSMKESHCNQQTDGNSCGIFTLMNAECIARGVPTAIMRQVHCHYYREYVEKRLRMSGTTKEDNICDMPGCNIRNKHTRWVQCCVCGRWMHIKCCGVPVKAALQEEFVCCICYAMYM